MNDSAGGEFRSSGSSPPESASPRNAVPRARVQPSIPRDEYIARAYDHLDALVVWATQSGIPKTDAEIMATKVFEWVMDDYERGGDAGLPYSRLRAYMAREIKRFRKARMTDGTDAADGSARRVPMVGTVDDIERAYVQTVRRRSGRVRVPQLNE